MTIRVVTAPAVEPVSLAEARLWLRLDADQTDEDALIEGAIAAMRAYAENLTGRAFVERGLQLVLSCWRSRIELPQPPLMSVDSVTYIDTDGNEQTLLSSLYTVHDWREPAVVVPAFTAIWPSTRAVDDAVRINYTAGYAAIGSPADDAASGVPDQVKLWMKARLSTLYCNREQLIMSNMTAIPRDFADGLLDDLVLGGRVV